MGLFMSDLKAKLLAAKLKCTAVKVPELDATVYIKRMSGVDRAIFSELSEKLDAEIKTAPWAALKLQPIILMLTLCDENGEKLFDNIDDIRALDNIVIDRLANMSADLSGLTKAAQEAIEKKVLEESTSGIG